METRMHQNIYYLSMVLVLHQIDGQIFLKHYLGYYHSIAVDLIGFGGSDMPKLDYTINRFREFVVDFMHAIKIDDGKTTVIGHSLGGYIAAELAIENSTMMENLVLIDSSGMLDKPTPLLEKYLDAAISASHEKVKEVFEQLVAQSWRVFPILIDVFVKRINMPGAKYAFESAFHNSTKKSDWIR